MTNAMRGVSVVINYIVWFQDGESGHVGSFKFDSEIDRDEFIAMTSLKILGTDEDEECYCNARSWGECACGNYS